MKGLDPASKDRGVKSENFTVIYKASMPSVLCEYGFYSNLEDLKILKNNKAEFDGNLYAVCVGAYKDKNKANAIVEELKKKGYTSTYLIIR